MICSACRSACRCRTATQNCLPAVCTVWQNLHKAVPCTHTHTHAAVFLETFGMSFTLQPVHCNTTIHSNLLMKWREFRWDFILFPIETWKKKPSGVTSVTEMHYILLEYKNISRKLAGFHYTETVWRNLSDDWFGGWNRWILLGMIFVQKHRSAFTLIPAKAVCQKRCHWKRICLRLIHMGSPYFTVRNTISHHWEDNHIGRKSSVRAYKLWHRHETHVKWLHCN